MRIAGLVGVLVLVVFVALAVLQAPPAADRPPAAPVVQEPATDSPMCVPDMPDHVPPPPDCWSPDAG